MMKTQKTQTTPETPNADRDVEQQERSVIASVNAKCATFEAIIVGFFIVVVVCLFLTKLNKILPASVLFGIYPNELKNVFVSAHECLHIDVCGCFIHNRQRHLSVGEWMNKL